MAHSPYHLVQPTAFIQELIVPVLPLGLGSYRTAWSWLHKLRRAMVRPGRELLAGWVEVDETYLGGLEEGTAGRGTEKKALIVIAAHVLSIR
jgi:hypothetical protein